ncbi:phosphocholine cytidylyltransferase family protein [Gammaproteobacteria bacterium]|nr:phosphocholine cytidylyltransferase family protein [Gammaproteobacteria bacterium]
MKSSKKVTTAVILAAGRGSRFKEAGKLMPKGFIEVKGKPIIEESIELLLSVGIKEIIIVTGHLAEFYENLAKKYPSITTILNKSYANSGSMYSLFQLDGFINKDFILLESDLVYEVKALKVLLNDPLKDCLLISGLTQSGDEVWVCAPNGKLDGLSKKQAELSSIHGELVGITKVSIPLFSTMCDIAKRFFVSSLDMEYETALAKAAHEYLVPCLKIDDLIWAEIDTEEQLENVRKNIYPKISIQ